MKTWCKHQTQKEAKYIKFDWYIEGSAAKSTEKGS